MKLIKYKYLIPCCLVLLVAVFACNRDFLNKQPQGALSANSLANKTGVQGLLIGAYHMLTGEGGAVVGNSWGGAVSDWTFGSVNADDSYKGSTPSDQGDIVPLETWSVSTAANPYVYQKWEALYDGIQRSNDVLRTLPLATDIGAADQKIITGEARFLRGVFHLEAKKIWNYPPYVDETIGALSKPASNIDASGNFVDIWPKIEADFQFAIDNLPETQPQLARANKWAAMAFLAKAYMFEHKYDKAKALLDQIITSGKTAGGLSYGLGHYQDNFNPATKNSKESIFAAQMSVNDGSGTNGDYGDNLNYPNNGNAPGGCCGFNNPSINLANAYKTNVNGLPLLDTWNSGTVVSDATNLYTGTLDPRIDWVMGRPGIPYLDWGPHGGASWIRDPATDAFFSPKKNVYASAQKGTLSSTETSFWGPTQMDANNYTFIRFADVLLWDAECEAQIGSLDKAEGYVNQVRNRAADKTGWVYSNSNFTASTYTYTTQTTPADNYFIKPYAPGAFTAGGQAFALKAIIFERRLELAMEGHRFFDLQRWDNGTGYMANVLNTYESVEKARPTIYSVNPGATFHQGINEWYPLPQNAIDGANSTGKVYVKQNKGY